jgi:hypothetical protein
MSSIPGDFTRPADDSRNVAHPATRLSRRAKWDLALWLGGAVYVFLMLALSLNAPLLSILFVAAAGYQLVVGRNR